MGVDHDHLLGLFCANLRFVTKTYHVPSVLVRRLIAHHGLTGEEGLNAFLSKRRDNRARWDVRIG